MSEPDSAKNFVFEQWEQAARSAVASQHTPEQAEAILAFVIPFARTLRAEVEKLDTIHRQAADVIKSLRARLDAAEAELAVYKAWEAR
jgi:hypothetical protein